MKSGGRHDDSGLLRVVGINERIKGIAATAFQVNIMALNAILLARRAGRMALGFSVLSNELRDFIRRIEGAMGRLSELTQETVRDVSLRARQAQIQRSLMSAEVQMARRDPSGAGVLREVLASRSRLAGLGTERAAALRKSMLSTLEDAWQLGQHGQVLARTARIEATYGGEFAGALTQVALDFDASINEIITLIVALRAYVEKGGAA